MSELQLQATCFQWLWNIYPETRLCCWHVTNEMKPYPAETPEQAAKRGCPVELAYPGESGRDFSIRVAKAKAAGLVSGVWDMHFVWNGFHIWEFKVGKNTLTKEQVAFKQAILRNMPSARFSVFYDEKSFQEYIVKLLNSDSYVNA